MYDIDDEEKRVIMLEMLYSRSQYSRFCSKIIRESIKTNYWFCQQEIEYAKYLIQEGREVLDKSNFRVRK